MRAAWRVGRNHDLGFAVVSASIGLANVAREALAAPPSVMGQRVIENFLRARVHAGVGPVMLALVVSMAPVKLSMRLNAS